jgi:peptidoglycan hydrolase-like protein with peptidoglycan-binding domain
VLLRNLGGYDVNVPATASGSDDCELGVGNESIAVALLQIDLNACYGQHLAVDWIYGPLTKAAVEVAQRDSGATVDGIYGPQTRGDIKWVDAFEANNPRTCFRL